MSRLIDLTGKTFGSRTVLRRAPKTPGAQAHWVVKCKCGKKDVVPSQRLRRGEANSCRKCGRAAVKKVIPMEGKTFGRWEVLERSFDKGTGTYWKTRCSCGREGVVSGHSLRSGFSKSCKACGSTKYWHEVDLNNPDWCWILGVFHGDGSTTFPEDGGGIVTFSCAPPECQQQIEQALDRVGVPWGQTPNGVHVYSVSLARTLARFKTSGRGREAWYMPESPTHVGEWLAGLLDSDGGVSKNGRVIEYYQKSHKGFDLLRRFLKDLEIEVSTYKRGRRGSSSPQETVRIRAGSRNRFKKFVHPRYPEKKRRINLPTSPPGHDLTGRVFGNRVALYRVYGSVPSKWMTRCSCGLERAVSTQKLLSGKSQTCAECFRSRGGSMRPSNDSRNRP